MNDWKEVNTSFWKPVKAGDELIGTVSGVEKTQFGEAFRIDTPEGIVLVNYTALSTSLASLLEERAQVKIVYKGEKKGESGRTYKDFSVFRK